jgi:hypothetical protein
MSPAREERDYIDRAMRFPIHASLQFREGQSADWHGGETVNISRTGILFAADRDLALASVVHLKISLPSPSNLIISCQGSVVRRKQSEHANSLYAVAIRRIER